MTEELIWEIQQRIDAMLKQYEQNPESFYNSLMHGIMLGLQEAQEVIQKWGEVYND